MARIYQHTQELKLPLKNVLKIEASGDFFRKDWEDPWN